MWVAAVYRQHSSLVVTLPKDLARRLKLSRGDHVIFENLGRRNAATIMKMVPRRVEADGKEVG